MIRYHYRTLRLPVAPRLARVWTRTPHPTEDGTWMLRRLQARDRAAGRTIAPEQHLPEWPLAIAPYLLGAVAALYWLL